MDKYLEATDEEYSENKHLTDNYSHSSTSTYTSITKGSSTTEAVGT